MNRQQAEDDRKDNPYVNKEALRDALDFGGP